MEIHFGPIVKWPRELAKFRTHSPFKAGYSGTMSLLLRELRMVSARSAVVQLALLPGEFRRDGMPRADARPSHPGVIVSFERPVGIGGGKFRHEPLSFPCDAYSTWTENLRAVALALEALRKVDRYGVTRHGEQYTGWRSLPPPTGDVMTIDEAAQIVTRDVSGFVPADVLSSPETLRRAYRERAKRLHPDANMGVQSSEWDKLQSAVVLLEKHHSQRPA